MSNNKTCTMCDASTVGLNTPQCLNCWEVTSRMEVFLKSDKAREWLMVMLNRYYPRYEFKIPENVDQRSMAKKQDGNHITGLLKIATSSRRLFTVRLPPPGQPNKNGDVFPEDQVYEVGAEIRVPHFDKPVGQIVEVYDDHVVVEVRYEVDQCPL